MKTEIFRNRNARKRNLWEIKDQNRSKIAILILLAILSAVSAFAQAPAKSDKIYKADNTTIDCKIMEVDGSTIKYKKANYLDGPTYSISKSEVVTIQYANGDSEVITAKPMVVQNAQNSPTSNSQNAGSSASFKEFSGALYFNDGIYFGANYDFFWRLDNDSKVSNTYLGFGIQGYYGDGTVGTYGDIGTNPNTGGSIDISGGDLSSYLINIPLQFRIFPGNSNFFLEAQLGPAFNFWNWSGVDNKKNYISDSGTKITMAPGINIGYLSRGGFGFTARWNNATGVGFGINISYLSRRK